MNEDKKLILQKIYETYPSSDSQISNELGIDLYKVRFCLDEMEQSNLIKQVKSTTFESDGEVHTVIRITSKGHLALRGEIPIDSNGDTTMTNNRTINIGNGNYNERIDGDYYQQSGNFGIGHMSDGEIKEGAKVAGVINEAERQNLAQAAAEIQALLKQLEQSYPTNTTDGKMKIATEAIERIDSDPTLTERILSALKVGSISALEQLLNHPAASFVIAALEDWQKTKTNRE